MSAGESAPPNLHAIEDVTSPPRAPPSHPNLASPSPEKQEPKEAYESPDEPEAPPSPPAVGAEIVATVLRLKSEKRPRSIELHGWRVWWQQRSAGWTKCDWYAVSPDGRQYRSMPELRRKFPDAFADGADVPKAPASQRTPAPCELAQRDAHTRSPMAERAGTSGAGSSASSSQPNPSPMRSPASASASGGGGDAARSQRAEIIPVGTRLEVDWAGKGTGDGEWYAGTVIEHTTELGRRAHTGVHARRRRDHV